MGEFSESVSLDHHNLLGEFKVLIRKLDFADGFLQHSPFTLEELIDESVGFSDLVLGDDGGIGVILRQRKTTDGANQRQQ